MFIVHVNYKVSLDVIEQHLTAHVDYLKQQYALGYFIASGRQVPRTGGLILSNMENREALNTVLEQDPFKQNNLADYVVTEFVPSMTCQELDFLKITPKP
ncbi:YciI family protein [Ancylomarina sp.]|uniref:YciI family protein n=1 Tax=Ancylomarina sp. TaxID=1970196 RepID=UPI0035659C8B